MRERTYLIKPTNRCQLSCKYCSNYFNMKHASVKDMSEKVLERTLSEIAKYTEKYHQKARLVWHGGEPLLMGLKFYEKVVKLEKDLFGESSLKNRIITNGIQTNLLLLDEEYLAFFVENNFNISFSLDGPKWLNDLQRVNINDIGTYDEIMKKIQLLRKGYENLYAISVVTRNSIGHSSELYNFFKTQKISVRFNPLLMIGKAERNSYLYISPEEYTDFLMELFDIYFHEQDTSFRVEPLYEIIGNLYELKNYGRASVFSCIFSDKCYDSILTIEPNGDVYLCNHFSDNEKYKYGNIVEESLESLLQSNSKKIVMNIKNTYIQENCISCKWRPICNGGCTYNLVMFGQNIFCKANQKLFSYISNKIWGESY